METERNGKTDSDTPFLAHGYRTDGEGSTIEWWTFDTETVKAVLEPENGWGTEEDYQNDLRWNGLGTWLTGKGRYYNGPGQSFGDDPYVRISKYHTLVTRRTGLDV